MTTENIALFKALGAKMDFLNQRQRVISQNIANTDTPGYRPKDLKPVDFGNVLQNVTKGKSGVRLETTDNLHMPPPGDVRIDDPQKQKRTYEVAPAGNAVIMEEQLINSGQTVMDYNLMTNLYQKNTGMIYTALGRAR
ncbi:MAG: flagellar basal body rod protein FlgB [Alphaproteobacteria bacterium]|nr:flagellar basal body rod protein FlgB [Alphaproteobacteria bacterium]